MAGLSRQSLNGIEQGTVNATLDSLCKRRDSRLDSCGQAVATTAQTAPTRSPPYSTHPRSAAP
ncbi:hypothetical protein [Cupriavidus sp. CuC1]|uniref:hypothetical protein n=1 Tax=Cupriavidus sp. CuC1 TaxID=3373131 RepID=UPI0037CEB5D7